MTRDRNCSHQESIVFSNINHSDGRMNEVMAAAMTKLNKRIGISNSIPIWSESTDKMANHRVGAQKIKNGNANSMHKVPYVRRERSIFHLKMPGNRSFPNAESA